MSKLFYGLDGQGKLDNDPEDVLSGVLFDACGDSCELLGVTLDRITWPIVVVEFQKTGKTVSYTREEVEKLMKEGA